jgi:toxin FitB
MYLVDTNVLSEARRGSKEARIWLRSIDSTTIYLTVITLGEAMKGIALKLRADARAAAALTAWLEQLGHDHSDRILPIADHIALEWDWPPSGRKAWPMG